MFANSSHVQISGNPQFTYIDNRNNLSAELLKDGIRLLFSRVVKGAMHNSGERFDAPTCHLETRIALQDDILGWADELVDDLNEIVTWLYGPAGAGKSAIAQTIAQKLHDQDQLTASFFFSRASAGEGRGAETDLIATLAYQLSQSVPATQPYIAATVNKNPLVFDLALQDQVNALIIAPLIAISETSTGDKKPRIIVVDGLDECRKEKDAQRRVVDALIFGLRQIPHHTHKLFITSRPEHNIVSIFNNYEQKILRKMELDNKWNPDDDIRTFLLSGFADIRRSHFYFQVHPADKTWPDLGDVRKLVKKSSGKFIYASVVLKYIKSEENYNPVTRLETILHLEDNEDQPYAELDAIYHHIFSQIKGVESILTLLSLEQLCESCIIDVHEPPLSTFLSEALGLDKGLIRFRLRPLRSILLWTEEEGIAYEHASLPDFLLDENRSGSFYINSVAIVTAIVSQVLKWFEDGAASKTKYGVELLGIPIYYARILPLDQRIHVLTLLSDFNVVETVLCLQGIDLDNIVLDCLSEYLNWVIAESESERYHNASGYLSKQVAQILTWVIDQMKAIDFMDNEHVDLWPFIVATHSLRTITECEISSTLYAVDNISGCLSPQLMDLDELDVDQMVLSWSLIPRLDWLDRSDLLGKYAMTQERYGVSLQRTAYYLLKLPEHSLWRLFDDLPDPYDDVSHLLLHDVLPTFFAHSPLTTDLGFLVALLYPVMSCFCLPAKVSDYLNEVIDEYPFFLDWKSKAYKQASATCINTLIDLKIETHLHEVAEEQGLTWLFEEKLPYLLLLNIFADIDSRAPEEFSDGEEEL